MNNLLIVIGIVVLLLVVGLSGCTNVDNQDTTQLSIALFNVEPSMINKGETANLSWNVTGATTVSIDNDIGNVSLSGTRIIAPIQNTTYVLTALNSTSSKTATTQIIALDKSEYDDDDNDNSVGNNPPTKPTVNGPTTGNKNTDYDYTAVSTDANNDAIQYTFYWGDGSYNIITDFLQSGVVTTQTHSWAAPGIYEISVKAYDNETESAATKLTVLIDTHLVKDIGYLIDDDSDGTYDNFYSDATGEQTDVDKQYDGTYLIDNEGNGCWDYYYNIETDELKFAIAYIACMTDSSADKISIISVSSGVCWSDIQAKTDKEGASINGHLVGTTWTVAINIGLSGIVQTWDSMLIAGVTGNVKVTMRHASTNSLIGSWTVNV